MVMTTTFSRWLIAGGLFAAGAAGCGVPTDDGEPAEPVQSSAAVMFSEPFADEGWLEVAADDRYAMGVAVQARIGSSAERLLSGASDATTLEQLWVRLHGGEAEAPPRVRELSAALLAQRLAHAGQPVPLAQPEPSPADLPAPEIEAVHSAITASEYDFNVKVCHDYREGNIYYDAAACQWNNQLWVLNTPYQMSNNGILADRSWGWNRSPYPGNRQLSASSWQPAINPYTFSWVQWGGNYTGARARLFIPTPANYKSGVTPPPELGITWHDAQR